MTIKTRVAKLEKESGGQSGKHYIWEAAKKSETKEEAIDRILQERGLTMGEVGYMWIMGPDFSETIDNGGYREFEDLIGWAEALEAGREMIANLPSTVGPPSERARLKLEGKV